MKYLLVLIVFMVSGCASISEYNQGCREGISYVSNLQYGTVVKTCDELESLHTQKEKIERQGPSRQ